MSTEESIFEFPCIFPLKVMGYHTADFEDLVVAVVQHHAPTSAQEVSRRLSNGSKYISVTVTFVAESQPQVDAIYQELHASGRVLMAL